MSDDALRTDGDAPRAPVHEAPATRPSTGAMGRPSGDHEACLWCHKPLKNRRPEARTCGGPCRAALSRSRRVRELADRVQRAEGALRASAEALAELRAYAATLGWRWPS